MTTSSLDEILTFPSSSSPSSSSSSSSSPSDNDNDNSLSLLSLPWSVIAVICVGMAIVTAVGGNLLILLSYGRDRQLRDVHNLYLVHLAVCDLLLGGVSMPLYLIYTVLKQTWLLGPAMCKVFLVEDFTLCCMSTLIVVLVAWDRLALLTLGLNYRVIETRKRAYMKLTICWICSFLLYSPAILFWDVVRGSSVVPSDDCDVEFLDNVFFVVISEVISFSVPFVSLTVINIMLFMALKERRKTRQSQEPKSREPVFQCCGDCVVSFRPKMETVPESTESNCRLLNKLNIIQDSGDSVSSNIETVLSPQLLKQCSTIYGSSCVSQRTVRGPTCQLQTTSSCFQASPITHQSQTSVFLQPSPSSKQSNQSQTVSLSTVPTVQLQTSSLAQDSTNQLQVSSFSEPSTDQPSISSLFQASAHLSHTHCHSTSASGPTVIQTEAQQEKEKRERRVGVILVGLVLALVVFWLPYSLTTILMVVCRECVNTDAYEVVNWLLWFKSCVNPFLYAYNSPRFRHNFQELLNHIVPARLKKKGPRQTEGDQQWTQT